MWVEHWNNTTNTPLWRHTVTGDVWLSDFSRKDQRVYYINPKTGERTYVKPFVSANEGYDDVATDIHRQKHQASTSKLRKYNNMVKRALINKAVAKYRRHNSNCWRIRVLDIACGKGGDLGKWMHHNDVEYYGFDASAKSIGGNTRDNANARASKYRKQGRFIRFENLDARRHISWSKLFQTRFHIISCQFALHYFFTTEKLGNMFFKRVSDALEPGGIFIATFSNASEVLRHLYFGKTGLPDYCKVTPMVPYHNGSEPIPYKFYLKGSVPNITEHAVRLRPFEKALNFNHMYVPVHVGSFSTFEYSNPTFPALDPYERAVANLYMAHMSIRDNKSTVYWGIRQYFKTWHGFDKEIMSEEQHRQCWRSLYESVKSLPKFRYLVLRILREYPCRVSRNHFKMLFKANEVDFNNIKTSEEALVWLRGIHSALNRNLT